MSEPRILFDRVWKKFHRGQLHDSLRDLIPAVAGSLFGRGNGKRELHEGDFWAIRDLSFEVLPGQTLGIIGPNGSGKSTSLKLLTRILEPTRGYCEVRGRPGALIEVSAGFHGDLTGRENVFLQGAIMGMKAADMRRKFDEIIEFSGVEDAIDTPVKRYSSGMNARLGFSIAAHLEPDVLIIDEVLAVGDLSFQERAFGRIRELARSGIPVVMVSHQLDRIAELCTDAILLTNGQVVARGSAADAISAYVQQHDALRVVPNTGIVHLQSLRADVEGPVKSGERCILRISGSIAQPVESYVDPLVIRVRSLRHGNVIYSTSSRRLGLQIDKLGPFSIAIDFQANLPNGSYMLEATAVDTKTQREIAVGGSVMLRVSEPGQFTGSVQLNTVMRLES